MYLVQWKIELHSYLTDASPSVSQSVCVCVCLTLSTVPDRLLLSVPLSFHHHFLSHAKHYGCVLMCIIAI